MSVATGHWHGATDGVSNGVIRLALGAPGDSAAVLADGPSVLMTWEKAMPSPQPNRCFTTLFKCCTALFNGFQGGYKKKLSNRWPMVAFRHTLMQTLPLFTTVGHPHQLPAPIGHLRHTP